jgi:hypothetical protein
MLLIIVDSFSLLSFLEASEMSSFSEDNAFEQSTESNDNVYDDFTSLPSFIPRRNPSQISYNESNTSSQLSGPSLPPGLLPVANAPNYVAWSLEKHAVFLEWWYKTLWGRDDPLVCKDTKRVKWERIHSSNAWSNFNQVAHHLTGEPALCCKYCGQILKHPTLKNTGTSNLSGHLQQSKCRGQKRSHDNENVRDMLLVSLSNTSGNTIR